MHPVWPLNRRFQALGLRPTGRWVLESVDDPARGSHLQVTFLGVTAGSSPRELHVEEICRVSGSGAGQHYLLNGSNGSFPVAARGLLVHETPGAHYRAVLPGETVPRRQRWLWRALLLALRIPGAFAFVVGLRNTRR